MVGVLSLERVACYIRVSTEEQKLHGISLDAQILKLTEYAEKHNLKIVEWYKDEGVSGRKLIKKRPELQRMIKDAQAKKFDRILFIKLDRFFRSVAEYHECMKLIDPVIWTATEEKYDLSTANGRAFVNMKITIAELEADQTGERIKIINDYKIKSGQAITGAHNQSLAFTVAKDANGVKRVIPDSETKELCMDCINHFLTYQSKRGTVAYINEKYNTDISFDSLTNLLRDTKLCGQYRGNNSYCEPYIDENTFNKIQAILDKNIKQNYTRRSYLFTGLIKCPVCAHSLSGTFSNRKATILPDGTAYREYPDTLYYRCNRYLKDGKCSFCKTVNELKTEKALLELMDQYVSDYIVEAKVKDDTKKSGNTAEKIKQIKSEMTRLNNMYQKNRITETEYDKQYDALNENLLKLEAKLEPVVERDLTIYEDLLKSDWKELYKALTRENKRAFWRKYIKEIVVDTKSNIKDVIFF